MSFMEYDSPIMTGINKVVDILLLSCLWFVCCIPIITIGVSTTALYYTSVKSIRKSRGYIVKTFFHAFRINFWPATLMWILFALGIVLFYINFIFASLLKDKSFQFFVATFYYALAFAVLSIGCYAFPVLSRCSMKCGEIMRFSAGLMVKHFPSTLVMAVIVVVSLYIMWMVPIFVFCLPVVGSLLFSFFMEKILIRYTPETERNRWYAERDIS